MFAAFSRRRGGRFGEKPQSGVTANAFGSMCFSTNRKRFGDQFRRFDPSVLHVTRPTASSSVI